MGLFFDLLTAPTEDNPGIPLGLVLKYPHVLNHTGGPHAPAILTSHSVKDLPAFQALETSVYRAVGNY